MALIKGKVQYRATSDGSASNYAGRVVQLFDVTDGNYTKSYSTTSDINGDYQFSFSVTDQDRKYVVCVFDDIGSEWSQNADYVSGDKVRPSGTLYQGFVYEIDSSGNSGLTEPSWPLNHGDAVSIGGATANAVEVGAPIMHGPIFIEKEYHEREYSILDGENIFGTSNISFVSVPGVEFSSAFGSGGKGAMHTAYPLSANKYYFEFKIDHVGGGSGNVRVDLGLFPEESKGAFGSSGGYSGSISGDVASAVSYETESGEYYPYDFWNGFAVDFILGKFWIRRNGTWINGDPEAGSGGVSFTPEDKLWYFFCGLGRITGNNPRFTMNSGQDAFVDPVPDGFISGWAFDRIFFHSAIDIDGSSANFTYSNKELSANCPSTIDDYESAFSVKSVGDGQYYVEINIDNLNGEIIVGVVPENFQDDEEIGTAGNGIGYRSDGSVIVGGSASAYGSAFGTANTIGIALSMDAGEVYFSRDGTFQNSSDPETETNPAGTGISGPHKIAVSMKTAGDQVTFNFGYEDFVDAIPADYVRGLPL